MGVLEGRSFGRQELRNAKRGKMGGRERGSLRRWKLGRGEILER